MFIKNYFEVRDRKTGERYDCFTQTYTNFFEEKVSRYNIGINGYTEWSFMFSIYDDKEFNEEFEVVRVHFAG